MPVPKQNIQHFISHFLIVPSKYLGSRAEEKQTNKQTKAPEKTTEV